jgi:hypothetical protein
MDATTPDSALTRERPELWRQAMVLAVGLTGYRYLPKLPLADGTIYACGGGAPYVPPPPPFADLPPAERLRKLRERLRREETNGDTPHSANWWERQIDELLRREPTLRDPEEDRREEEKRREIERIDGEIGEKKREIGDRERERDALNDQIERLRREIDDLTKERDGLQSAPSVFVPEGAMEWLLHEVGHWVAATPNERTLHAYGLKDVIAGKDGDFERIVVPSGHIAEREWEAWAFEEIILAPFGRSRDFLPPTQRDGVAFAKAGPIPDFALRHVEVRLCELNLDVEQWRALMGQWVRWGASRGRGRAPWEMCS